jgi:hypothetical protein
MMITAFTENLILLAFIVFISRATVQIISRLQENMRRYNREFRDLAFSTQLLKALMIMAFVIILYVARVVLYVVGLIPVSIDR